MLEKTLECPLDSKEIKTGDNALDEYIAQNGAEVKLKDSKLPWEKVRCP